MSVFYIKILKFILNRYRSPGISKKPLEWEAFQGADAIMQQCEDLSGINKTKRAGGLQNKIEETNRK